MAKGREKIDRLQEELSERIGPEWVTRKGASLILKPRTAEEVAAILKAANRTETPVRPRGGGTGWWSSTLPPADGILLQLTRMNEILAIDEDVMTVRVDAGITFAKLEEALGAKGYRIMIFPESGRTATMGGHIQTWGTSPHTSSVDGGPADWRDRSDRHRRRDDGRGGFQQALFPRRSDGPLPGVGGGIRGDRRGHPEDLPAAGGVAYAGCRFPGYAGGHRSGG